MTNAKDFYGSSYTKAKDPSKLDAACKFLDMACRADNDTKANMAFNAALKNENEAFA